LSKEGKVFEESLEASCKSLKIFFNRIKDVSIPPDLRNRVKVARNKYDCMLFDSGHLFTLELKSTKNKSISFDESIIKQHQIDNLLEASRYDQVISGFILNFRIPENKTYFISIDDFITYKNVAEGNGTHTYKSKINKSSIPIAICEEIGLEIPNYKKKTKYHYHMKIFTNAAIQKYSEL
jgi:penicillin-binding protein-related factor A (putative recombinase)